MPDMYNKGEYDFLQREAQNRVYKMRENGKKAAQNQSQNNKNDAKQQKESNVITQGITKPKNQENTVVKHGSLNLMDMIMKDKERSLIILLIILLSQENSNPGLILSLIYLLI